VPGFVLGGEGGGGVPAPGGGRPGVLGVLGRTASEPRLNEITPLGSTHRIRHEPGLALSVVST
jgi:hypothetical protein